MANYVSNLIVLNGESFNMAKLGAISDTSVFDFNKIMPVPEEMPETFSSLDCLSLAHLLYGLDLKIDELESLLSPVAMHISTPHIVQLNKEYEDLIALHYSDDGFLKNSSLSNQYPPTLVQFDLLGQKAYDNLKNHGAVCAYDWCGIHWNTKQPAEGIVSKSNTISFHTRWSSPFPVVAKWAKDHKLSLTYKAFESGCFWWFVAEFVDGELISKRDSDKQDFKPLIKEIYGYSDEEIEEYYVLD